MSQISLGQSSESERINLVIPQPSGHVPQSTGRQTAEQLTAGLVPEDVFPACQGSPHKSGPFVAAALINDSSEILV